MVYVAACVCLFYSKVLEHMKSQDMAVNESIFNALVKGHMINR